MASITSTPVNATEVNMAEPDDEPVRKRSRLERLPLDTLGVEELQDYISELQAEIVRVEADIARKQSHRNAADAFFRRPPQEAGGG
jgi:uncharacterized small protein (DUF1192 family)